MENTPKQLRRAYKGAIVGGVCAGLGKYFEVDPWVFRIIFLVTTLVGGGGLLVYILLWLFIPSENVKGAAFSCARVFALLGIVLTAIVMIVFIATIFSTP